MKNHTLSFEYSYECMYLIGISSILKDYNLAWWLNRVLNFKLIKDNDLLFDFKDKSYFYVSNFIFKTEYCTFRLLKNKSIDFNGIKKPFIAPELAQFDYFLLINGEIDVNIDDYRSTLSNLQLIQMTQNLELDKVTSKMNFLF